MNLTEEQATTIKKSATIEEMREVMCRVEFQALQETGDHGEFENEVFRYGYKGYFNATEEETRKEWDKWDNEVVPELMALRMERSLKDSPLKLPDRIVDLVLEATDNSKLSDVASFHVDITEGDAMTILAKYRDGEPELWMETPDGRFELIRKFGESLKGGLQHP